MRSVNLYRQKVDHLEEEHPNCTDTTYEFSFSSEVPTGYQYGMLYDLVIEQVKSEDVWWISLTRRLSLCETQLLV